jgi:hypothetical protein
MRETGDEVAAPEFCRINFQFTGCRFNSTLKQIGGLRPSGPAIGINRCSVRINGIDLGIDIWNVVLPRKQRGVEISWNAG